MGGGNWTAERLKAGSWGLSPRGRGKPAEFANDLLAKRSIPAWAGETPGPPVADSMVEVYPRVGGGNDLAEGPFLGPEGLSPRGRGKLMPGQDRCLDPGSIPAWAGETERFCRLGSARRVYPRVGGGNRRRSSGRYAGQGLSPRGRGKRPICSSCRQRGRSIPAWAGETPCSLACSPANAVYPRVGGGNSRSWCFRICPQGLSPRGRGKLPLLVLQDLSAGSIPAWAGETRAVPAFPFPAEVYPRVGGGNSCRLVLAAPIRGLSPRGRGKLGRRRRIDGELRSIPAWAGETACCTACWASATVYPRVGGGNDIRHGGRHYCAGLSPRGRGKRKPSLP